MQAIPCKCIPSTVTGTMVALSLISVSAAAGANGQSAVVANMLSEFETSYTRDNSGSTMASPGLANLELGFDVRLGAGFGAYLLLQKEADSSPAVDEIYAHYRILDRSALSVSIGTTVAPFGVYESGLISDSLTKLTGETRSRGVILRWAAGDGNISSYHGVDSEEGGLPQYSGIHIGYGRGEEWRRRDFGISYISHLGASFGVRDSLTDASAIAYTVPGIGVSAGIGSGRVRFVGETVVAARAFAASDLAFAGEGASLRAFNLELGWKTRFPRPGIPLIVSVAYQGSAHALVLDLPEERLLAGASIDIGNNASLSLQWSNDRDYATDVGGTGADSNTYTMQLAIEI